MMNVPVGANMRFIIFIVWYSMRSAKPVNVELHHFSLKSLQPRYYQGALDLICSEFLRGSPLHQAVGLSADQFTGYMTDGWQQTMQQCPVPALVAVQHDTQKVSGCLIPAPFPTVFSGIEQQRAPRKAISRLLQSLEDQYLNSGVQVDNALMVDIAVVNKASAGNGIYQQMRRQIHITAAEHGYTSIYGALSSAVTQRVCVEKFGQRVVSEIHFESYFDDGVRPFSSIAEPPSIQLVSGSLDL